MFFALENAVSVRRRDDGLLEKDTFDISTAVPTKDIPQIGEGKARYSKPLSDQDRARALYELTEKEAGRELPISKKVDWALTSDKARDVVTAVETTLLTGGAYPVVQGVRGALDAQGDYNMFDRLWRGIINPEETARLTDKLAVENEPTWAKITRSVAEDVLSYGVVGVAGSMAKTRLFARDIARKVSKSADEFVASKIGSAPAQEGVLTGKQAQAVASMDDLKDGFIRAQMSKLGALEVSASGGVKTSAEALYERKSMVNLILSELDNLTIRPQGLGSGLSVKIGQKVSFNEGGKDLVGTITELVGKRATIEMGGRQVVAMLSQLRVPEVVDKKPQDFATAEEYVASIRKIEDTAVKNNVTDKPYEGKFTEGELFIDSIGEDPYYYRSEYVDPKSLLKRLNLEGKTYEQVVNMPTTQKYIEWYKEGKLPPPVGVVRHMDTGDMVSTNRRRVVAAIEAGVNKIPAVVEQGRKSQLTSEWQSAQGVTPPPPEKPTAVSPGDEEMPEFSEGGEANWVKEPIKITPESVSPKKRGISLLEEKLAKIQDKDAQAGVIRDTLKDIEEKRNVFKTTKQRLDQKTGKTVSQKVGRLRKFDDDYLKEELAEIPKHYFSEVGGLKVDEAISELNESGENIQDIREFADYLRNLDDAKARLESQLSEYNIEKKQKVTMTENALIKEKVRVAEMATDEANARTRKMLDAIDKQTKKMLAKTERATRDEIFDIQSDMIKLLDESGLELKDKAKFIKAIKNIQTQEDLAKAMPDIERRINRLLERQEVKKQLGLKRQQLAYSIIQKKFEKVDSLRTAMGLPNIKDMSLEQVEAFEAELGKYQEGDVFLTQRQLETVDNTDLSGIKTLREAREALAREAGVPVSELSKVTVSELDRMTYDVALAEKNPFYSLIVQEYHRNKIEADLLTREFEQELNELTNTARASRKQSLIDKLVPTDKLVFEYLSNPSAELVGKMTPEELDLAFFLEARFSDALEYLISTEALKTGRENYITNIRRGAFEAIKEDGLVAAFKEVLDQYKQDAAVFNILDSITGQILPLEKFFQFAMQRKGGIKPSENVAKAASVYFRTLYTKQALDKFIPKMMIYVDALTPTKLTPKGLEQDQSLRNFVKEWVNSKKGRKTKLIVKQGGMLDVITTGLKAFVSIVDLGLNIPAGIAANVGEAAASFTALGAKQMSAGVARFATKQGQAIVKKYEGFVGRTVWDELLEPSKDIGDKAVTTLFGLFSSSSTRANKIGLLGSLTEAEFNAGEVSADRLLDIKMTLGRFRVQPGMKSVLENTTEGGILTQYKTWALPILSTIVGDLAKFSASAVKGKLEKKEAVELSRALMVTLAALAVGSVYDDSKRDTSFTGQLIRKVKREALTIIGALDPKMWLATPRLIKWLDDLGIALNQLILLEKYKSRAEKYRGKIKGVEALNRLLVPRALKQFNNDKPRKKIKIRD